MVKAKREMKGCRDFPPVNWLSPDACEGSKCLHLQCLAKWLVWFLVPLLLATAQRTGALL